MRILIVTPLQPQATGNQVTARRHQEQLLLLGHEVVLTMTAEDNPALLRMALREVRPQLVHLLHAYRAGRPWLGCRSEFPLPWVVTLTGTDINHGINTAAQGPVIREVLAGAGAVISQNPLTAAALKLHHPDWRDRLHYLPPGVVLGRTPFPLRKMYGIAADTVLFFHPAGIRPVKGNVELLTHFDQVAAARSNFKVVFCGPVLDDAYADEFFALLAVRPWALYLDVIPSTAMAAALQEVDVVLNHSVSEGMPNSLLEAVAVGRPLLVRDIPGNAAVAEENRNALLYRDVDGLVRGALALIDDADLRRRLSHPQPERFAPEQETRVLVDIYRKVLDHC